MYAPTSSRLYAVARPRPDELINGEGSGVNCYNALRRRCTSLPAGQDECPIFDFHGLLDKSKGSTSGGGDERKMAVVGMRGRWQWKPMSIEISCKSPCFSGRS